MQTYVCETKGLRLLGLFCRANDATGNEIVFRVGGKRTLFSVTKVCNFLTKGTTWCSTNFSSYIQEMPSQSAVPTALPACSKSLKKYRESHLGREKRFLKSTCVLVDVQLVCRIHFTCSEIRPVTFVHLCFSGHIIYSLCVLLSCNHLL